MRNDFRVVDRGEHGGKQDDAGNCGQQAARSEKP